MVDMEVSRCYSELKLPYFYADCTLRRFSSIPLRVSYNFVTSIEASVGTAFVSSFSSSFLCF